MFNIYLNNLPFILGILFAFVYIIYLLYCQIITQKNNSPETQKMYNDKFIPIET